MRTLTALCCVVALMMTACESDSDSTPTPTPDPGGDTLPDPGPTPDPGPDPTPDPVYDPWEGPTVTITGTTYRFNSPDPVPGAVVSLAEYPQFSATSGTNGFYEIEAPDGADVTPYVQHPDYVVMHVQTFHTDGAGFDLVNFQMVNPQVFELLALALELTPDPEKCQLASTVSEKVIQTMTFEEFAAHGAHGVAGATVTTEPFAGDVTYFNEQVIPDKTHTETSRDGGVVWTNLDPGVYTLKATHPTLQFDEPVITCEPGRLLNANPPWGIREL